MRFTDCIRIFMYLLKMHMYQMKILSLHMVKMTMLGGQNDHVRKIKGLRAKILQTPVPKVYRWSK